MGAGLILALGCFGFLALCFVGIVVLAAMGSGDGGSSSVEDKSVLRMKLSGGTPEYVRSSGFDELFGDSPVTVRQHVFNLEKAAADKRIKGVLLELGPMEGTGWAKVEELRDALVEFKKSGKFVVAFSEYLVGEGVRARARRRHHRDAEGLVVRVQRPGHRHQPLPRPAGEARHRGAVLPLRQVQVDVRRADRPQGLHRAGEGDDPHQHGRSPSITSSTRWPATASSTR